MITRAWVWGQTLSITDEKGASLVEYALLVALIAAVAIGIITTIGGNISSTLEDVNTKITN